jgi:ribosomal protein L35
MRLLNFSLKHMPKIKTKKILAKKMKISATGKLMRSHQLRSGHLRRNKSKQALRRHAVPMEVHKTIERSFRRLLGKE